MSPALPKAITTRDGQRVVLREPTPADAEAAIAYLDCIRRESRGVLFGPDDPLPGLAWEREWFAKALADEEQLKVGAWHEGRLIGLADLTAGQGLRRQRHRGDIGISVARAWWGRGVGRALMDELIAFAESRPSIEVMQLYVYHFNERAIRLYERAGFRATGRRRWAVRFEDGSYADEVMMSRWVGPGDPPCSPERDASLGSPRRAPSAHGVGQNPGKPGV